MKEITQGIKRTFIVLAFLATLLAFHYRLCDEDSTSQQIRNEERICLISPLLAGGENNYWVKWGPCLDSSQDHP
jgi:hypothetical protein